uniref:NADH dehydrogenase subunit 3 n=1 Tax=Ascaris lumbricoides TaxID=6252 RepID=A0A0M3HL54_ASCLU
MRFECDLIGSLAFIAVISVSSFFFLFFLTDDFIIFSFFLMLYPFHIYDSGDDCSMLYIHGYIAFDFFLVFFFYIVPFI